MLQVGGPGIVGLGQRVVAADDQHLLVIKHRGKHQARLVHRVGGDEQINLVIEQRRQPAELEFLLHIHLHIGPRGQIGCYHFEQPLVARVALHANAQAAALALGNLRQLGLHLFELRQHPLRQDQHLLPRRGQAQARAPGAATGRCPGALPACAHCGSGPTE